jgi:hypothetical protein
VFIRSVPHVASSPHDPTFPVDLRPAAAMAQFFPTPCGRGVDRLDLPPGSRRPEVQALPFSAAG